MMSRKQGRNNMGEYTIGRGEINRIKKSVLAFSLPVFALKVRPVVRDIAVAMEFARFEWGLVSFAVGICIYFALPFEPPFGIALTILAIFVLLFALPLPQTRVNTPILLISLVLTGLAYPVFHTYTEKTPILPTYREGHMVTGWIEDIRQSGKLQHIYVRVVDFEKLEPETTPERVRIRIKPGTYQPGDGVRVRALLNRPPIPVISDGYDAGRRAYFQKIGGYGFALSDAELVEMPEFGIVERFQRNLTKARFRMSRHIQARAPPKTAGLQAALLTGDRSALPETQAQSLRDAGLAHLLAISGLHMGLLAGGAYWAASLFFAMIGPWARRYDMRKAAAMVGALFAIGYLLLSGASISTQRAFIMAIIVFAAIILDRRAVSLRSVAVAAAITLVLHPESLLGAGFQMSFAATAALVVVYRLWADNREIGEYKTGILSKLWAGVKGLSVTSLVAGTATAGFAALHFHRVAKFGFIGNLAAMPIFTFVVMPAGFVAVLMMPLGLDAPFLKIMGVGLDIVLVISDWVSGLRGAIVHIQAANGLVMALFSLGFVFMCLGPKSVRISGLGLLIASVFIWAGLSRPDIRVSQDGRVAFWDVEQINVLRVDRVRADKFGRARFIEQSGLENAELKTYFDTAALCDMLGCRFSLKGMDISIVQEPEVVMEACLDSDLVILTERVAGPVARRKCTATLIDTKDLIEAGAHDISIKDQAIAIKTSNPNHRQSRPWGG
jgi:competence protein ComEC